MENEYYIYWKMKNKNVIFDNDDNSYLRYIIC